MSHNKYMSLPYAKYNYWWFDNFIRDILTGISCWFISVFLYWCHGGRNGKYMHVKLGIISELASRYSYKVNL